MYSYTVIVCHVWICDSVGVRYFIRGVDDDGHVANYVETEQMMIYQGYRASFVQVTVPVAGVIVLRICEVDGSTDSYSGYTWHIVYTGLYYVYRTVKIFVDMPTFINHACQFLRHGLFIGVSVILR